MKRFVCAQQLRDTEFKDELQASMADDILSRFSDLKGSVASQTSSSECKPAVEAAFDGTEMRLLVEKYHRDSGHTLQLFRSYRKMKSLMYKGLIYGSVLSRRNCSHIVAKHPRKGVQVAQIQHFCFHQVKQSSHGLPLVFL